MASDNVVPDAIALRVGAELCRYAGAGRPDHPHLRRDIERAAFVALHSPTFRALLLNANTEETSDAAHAG